MSGPGGLVAVLDAVRGLALLALTLFEHQFAVAVGVLGQVLPEQPAELLDTYGGGAVLPGGGAVAEVRSEFHPHAPLVGGPLLVGRLPLGGHRDRKSTRLNSSHVAISYAVFCLKKKNT